MKQILLSCLLITALQLPAQNIGINNPTPQFPLSFNSNLGDKLSLWNDGSATHYGMGIQAGLLQLFAKTSSDNIAFGYGNSNSFTERMRVINTGELGLQINGRLVLRNGTIPANDNYAPGIWFNKPDNSGFMGFMGVQSPQNMGFYGGVAGWGFVYDAINSRIGIGTISPDAPLSFPALLGKKITLYPGGSGNAGIGISGNRLQIYSDNSNADIALGYDAAGTFNERFAFKPNGALAINGSVGGAGQVLSSNGGGAASWINIKPTFYAYKQSDYQLELLSNSNSPGEATGWYTIAGLHNQTIVLSQPSLVKLSVKLPITNGSNAFGGVGNCSIYLGLYDAANNYIDYDYSFVEVGDGATMDGVGFYLKLLPAGTYRTHVKVRRYGGDDLGTGAYYTGLDKGSLLVEVYPQ